MNTESRSFNLWPYAIIGVFVVFIAATVSLIVIASSNRMELVSGDYYEQEVRYQLQMESAKRTQSLGGKASVALDSGRRQIVIAVPTEHVGKLADGSVQLYRPSSAGLDRRMNLEPTPEGRQFVDVSAMPHGLWKVRVQWKVGADEFLLDESVKL
jgi:hypothetical protein